MRACGFHEAEVLFVSEEDAFQTYMQSYRYKISGERKKNRSSKNLKEQISIRNPLRRKKIESFARVYQDNLTSHLVFNRNYHYFLFPNPTATFRLVLQQNQPPDKPERHIRTPIPL